MELNNEIASALPAKILAVDDNPANLLALEAVLDEPGTPLVKAKSGEEALQLLAKEEFAAVLLDVFLPGLDGFAIAERTRQLSGCAHLPIIFLTAYTVPPEDLERAYLLGAVDFLVKPIPTTVLKAKIATFVQLYRQQLRARRESEQLRLLVDSTKDYAIFVLDPTGHVASWNLGAERIKQYRADEILGQHFSTFYTEDAIQRGWPDHELKVALAEGRIEDEGWRIRKDGSRFWASVVITALFDKTGQLQGFSKITRDNTERKRAEAALQKANEDLERRVAERTAELAVANRALLQADQRKDEFLATLAHELRNPLAPIRNSLQILKLSEIDDQTVRETREVMERQLQHLIRLVDDLLDISRVMKGKIDLKTAPVEIAEIITRATEMVRPLIDAQRHQFEVELPIPQARVNADAVRMTQVLGNLLTNAAKYTEPGGRISVRAFTDGPDIVTEVRDNGIGIDSHLLPHVFELFVQADNSVAKSQGGLGIGLTLAQNLAVMHRGSITVRSEGLGSGSCFWLRLPRVSVLHEQSSPHDQQVPSVSESFHRVLVVDDNRDAANSLAMLLRLLGHEVDVAYDGPHALNSAEKTQPSVVFLDIGMPGMDGCEVAREMRLRPELSDACLVALTGWGQPEDRSRTSAAGFDHHLVKPPNPEALSALLNSVENRN